MQYYNIDGGRICCLAGELLTPTTADDIEVFTEFYRIKHVRLQAKHAHTKGYETVTAKDQDVK